MIFKWHFVVVSLSPCCTLLIYATLYADPATNDPAVEVETISVNWQTRTNWVYCELGINILLLLLLFLLLLLLNISVMFFSKFTNMIDQKHSFLQLLSLLVLKNNHNYAFSCFVCLVFVLFLIYIYIFLLFCFVFLTRMMISNFKKIYKCPP